MTMSRGKRLTRPGLHLSDGGGGTLLRWWELPLEDPEEAKPVAPSPQKFDVAARVDCHWKGDRAGFDSKVRFRTRLPAVGALSPPSSPLPPKPSPNPAQTAPHRVCCTSRVH
jgi:hypothetical protein